MMLNQDPEVQGKESSYVMPRCLQRDVQICEWLYNQNQNTLLIKEYISIIHQLN